IDKEVRSIVNVCFSLKNDKLENEFLRLAKLRGLDSLKGHRLVGGIRASIYNAMPIAGVDALIDFMSEFAKENSR
ncbi:MAG: 3-phosphoserine/phosphohydroxythreonine transaminase, partial [Legionella longbeachae]|nr:3-phosphoserine/phosphohydroxythreonine transaminase [Legionella longbeachae]